MPTHTNTHTHTHTHTHTYRLLSARLEEVNAKWQANNRCIQDNVAEAAAAATAAAAAAKEYEADSQERKGLVSCSGLV
jgi:hypothetical protein